MVKTMNDIFDQANELFEYTRELRRDLHQHPELGYHEVRTAGIVARELGQLGLEVTTGVAETGVVALLEGSQPGPVALLRFDMDALPIQEETGAEFSSLNPGVMHACGHDGHVAIGLTVARILHERREQIKGAVKLVFQPAEEGLGGAERMMEAGVLNLPQVDYTLALHVWNERPVGWVGVTTGPLMAGADIFDVRIDGKGGHGALPQELVDPVVAAAQIISGLQTIVSRNISPLDTAVVSVCRLRAGEAFNVIPQFVEFGGTLRTFEPAVREKVVERFSSSDFCDGRVLWVQSGGECPAPDPGCAQRSGSDGAGDAGSTGHPRFAGSKWLPDNGFGRHGVLDGKNPRLLHYGGFSQC